MNELLQRCGRQQASLALAIQGSGEQGEITHALVENAKQGQITHALVARGEQGTIAVAIAVSDPVHITITTERRIQNPFEGLAHSIGTLTVVPSCTSAPLGTPSDQVW